MSTARWRAIGYGAVSFACLVVIVAIIIPYMVQRGLVPVAALSLLVLNVAAIVLFARAVWEWDHEP